MAAKPKPRMIGRYIVADPAVCHGQPTFRGTRILVADVLEQVSAGMAWERRGMAGTGFQRGYRRGRCSQQVTEFLKTRLNLSPRRMGTVT